MKTDRFGNKGFHADLVVKLKELVPKGNNLASIMMDILCLSKESIYRRMRGEVSFTLEEIALLARYFDISIDEVIKCRSNSYTVFNGNVDNYATISDGYFDMLARYAGLFESMKKDPQAEFNCATSNLSSILFSPYKCLLKFRLVRQLSYDTNSNIVKTFDETNIPDRIINIHKELCQHISEIPSINLIWDSTIFSSLIKEILYFRSLNILNDGNVSTMRQELLLMIDDIEEVAVRGYTTKGNTMSIYISNINIEASYSHLQKIGYETSLLRSYYLSSADMRNDNVCNIQKNWIMSLKRHSTLISKSGEMERIKFFKAQRQLVENMYAID